MREYLPVLILRDYEDEVRSVDPNFDEEEVEEYLLRFELSYEAPADEDEDDEE